MTMKRRTMLKVLSGAVAGHALGFVPRAWGQTPPTKVVDLRGTPGVSARDIKIGMSAAFKGSSAGLPIWMTNPLTGSDTMRFGAQSSFSSS